MDRRAKMIWNRIVIKLGGTILLLFLMVLLPLGFVIDRAFSGFYYQEVRAEIEDLSSRYAESIAASNNPQTPYMLEMMSEFSKIKLYIVDAQGTIIVTSGVPSSVQGTLIPDEEVQTLLQGKSVEKEFIEPLDNQRYLVSGTPIISKDQFNGGVYVVSSVNVIDESLEKIRSMLWLSGMGAFFLALAFTYILSKKLSDPLIQMEKATRKIAKGDLKTRVTPPSKDEMGSLAQAINDLALDLQKYRESRSEFFSNISHELRTPMTSIEGYAKVLKEKLYDSEEEKEQYLDIIHQESIRLTRIIGDLFELSKIEEGKIGFHFEWIDLSEVLNSAIQKTKWRAQEKGLDMRAYIQPDLPFVYCDGHRMAQVFMNLLDNAIRYTEQGTISAKMTKENDVVKISVEDTGIGIPEDELTYIFERFYRVEKSRSREFGGTGLGLAIVKNLVEQQGGSIRAFSEVGKGTRFEIKFLISPDIKKEEEEE
ncbi:HAMP domain-containing sensor histidine kinase [Niallia taxi]|uniref:histidine kinase n=7 Tax=Bacillati TaxID=1783272 RepID=A0A437K748_9BACI|nr:ATP-binding protein [Niallia taxi]MDK8642993.1 ATP-binding protein [Niallia taxi]MED4038255.1 ATP-binding protein [Niallia taxi]MED4055148.1 ATP-binding protein [Niallia taxi]MED4120662.1 ATP-binding protein [Niallia taxi]RVT59413.1 HAMP domain-containing histidine kinase [Niallia taxi]